MNSESISSSLWVNKKKSNKVQQLVKQEKAKLKAPTNIVDKTTKKSSALWHQQAAARVNAGCVEEEQNVLQHSIQKKFSFHSAGHPSTQMPLPLKGRRVLLHKLRYISSSTETAVSSFTHFLPPKYGLSNSCTNWICIQNRSHANSYLAITAWSNTSFLLLPSANRDGGQGGMANWKGEI